MSVLLNPNIRKPHSLQELIDSVPNLVEYFYKNPPKTALNIFLVLMPPMHVKPEYTNWRNEQLSWRESVAFHDLSYHMNNLYLHGPDALVLLERLAINSFRKFEPGHAKQLVVCSPEGYVIGDAVLYYLKQESFLIVGNAPAVNWIYFHAETGGYDVKVEIDPLWVLNPHGRRSVYRYQIEGPNALNLLEKLHGSTLPELKFFHTTQLHIAGCQVLVLRHSMGGMAGFELSGTWEEREKVKDAILQAGEEFGLFQVGSLAYFTTVIESGWFAVPVPAIYTSPALRTYREWLPANTPEARWSLGGSFYSRNIEDYYLTPWELGYRHILKFDHDFIGREALEAKKDSTQHRRKVTLVWNPEDVIQVFHSLFQHGKTAKHIELPLALCARLHYDKVLNRRGEMVGISHYPSYSYNERAMLSLGVVEESHSQPGTELIIIWGEEEGGNRSFPWVESHVQVQIRATVFPTPIMRKAQKSF